MITKLIIENFKAIEHLELELGPFTVLIGPNDAGKSTILQALELVSRCTSMRLADVLAAPFVELVTQGDDTRTIAITAEGSVDDTRYEYRFEAHLTTYKERLDFGVRSFETTHDGASNLGHDSLVGLRRELAGFLARFNPQQLTAQAKLGTPLSSDGSGLAALLDALWSSANLEPRSQIETALHRLFPFVQALGTEVSADKTGKRLTYLLTQRKAIVPGRQMSDGIVLATALFALRYATSYGRYLIEEPETGVHPHAIASIIDALRELSNVCGAQVVVTTHSPLLLNYVDPEDVLLVTRSEHRIRATRMIETRFFDERSREFDLGELWYNIGEEELVASDP